MKTVNCRKCETPFEMPDTFNGKIYCENCDRFYDSVGIGGKQAFTSPLPDGYDHTCGMTYREYLIASLSSNSRYCFVKEVNDNNQIVITLDKTAKNIIMQADAIIKLLNQEIK
jgi:hypothetical protein